MRSTGQNRVLVPAAPNPPRETCAGRCACSTVPVSGSFGHAASCLPGRRPSEGGSEVSPNWQPVEKLPSEEPEEGALSQLCLRTAAAGTGPTRRPANKTFFNEHLLPGQERGQPAVLAGTRLFNQTLTREQAEVNKAAPKISGFQQLRPMLGGALPQADRGPS